jgi:hypothetical protein
MCVVAVVVTSTVKGKNNPQISRNARDNTVHNATVTHVHIIVLTHTYPNIVTVN